MAQRAKKETRIWQIAANQQRELWARKTQAFQVSPHRRRQILFYGVLPLLGIILLLQLLYPTDRGLPFASIAGESMFWVEHDKMAQAIAKQFDQIKLKITIGNDKSVEFLAKSAGAEPNTEVMINKLREYPLLQRLIPGSILWQAGELKEADIYYSGMPFQKFLEGKSKELSFPPQNARLTIEDGRLKATEAIKGSTVSTNELLATISRAKVQLGKTTVIEAPSKRQAAARTSKDLAKVRGQAEAALAHTVAIKVENSSFSPDAKEIASWIVLATGENGDVTLSIDKEKVKAYLYDVNNKVGTPAGQTNITIVDGREVGRVTGSVGRAIDVTALADQIASSLLLPPTEVAVAAQFIEVQPSIIFNSKYTATQAGLQAYLNDTARSRNMRISVQQLDGERWTAGARDYESIPSGSTYKLFVALVLFDKVDKGEIHWDDPMLDTTVAGCFDRMTVASTNPCAESWIAQFGRQYINDFIYARGFSSGTSFTTGSANQTTAADLTKYMIGLNDGTLVSGANRERLLNNLGRHPYRYGIPTGSRGQVNDKVGFLWDYIHDTAIVRHPRGTYILTIMTKGQSYGAIASVTREIERIMYP